MIYSFKLNFTIEIAIRLLLWFLFIWFDAGEPFIRQISPTELWKYQFPVTQSYVPSRDLWIIIFLFPLLFLATEYFIAKDTSDVFQAVMGLSLSYGLNGFLTSFIKVLVGRPRPDFYHRCYPEGGGTDMTKCTGIRSLYLDGRKSFPSGHSSFAFSCMVFMTLYTARKVGLWDKPIQGQAWKICACIAPILVATSIAISRTCDYHHHYEDVIVGSLLGSLLSYCTFQLYLPKADISLPTGK